MEHDEREILYEMERVDLEFAVVKSLAKSFREKGKIDIANHLQTAADHLQKATFSLSAAYKWIGASIGEQIKMNFFDE